MAFYQPQAATTFEASPDYSTNPFVTGYELNIIDDFTFSVGPGSARAYASDFVIMHTSYTIASPPISIIDVRNVGLLGCSPWAIDSLNLPDQTVFNVYAIADSTGKLQPSFVVATGNNFLPTGYNCWRKIGTVFINDVDSSLFLMSQSGTGIERKYLLDRQVPGAAYGPTTNFLIPLSTGAGPCSPYFTTEAMLNIALTSANYTDYVWVLPTATTAGTSAGTMIRSPALGQQLREFAWIQTENDEDTCNLYVTVSGVGASAIVSLGGWKEELSLNAI